MQISADALTGVLSRIPDPVAVKDRNHRHIFLNDAMCTFIGRPREELVGRTLQEFLPKDLADQYWKEDEAVFATGEEHEVEVELAAPNGRTRLLRTRRWLATVSGPDGDQLLLMVSIVDMTGMRTIQRELEESLKGIRSIANATPGIIWVTDANNELTFVNHAWQDLTGQPDITDLRAAWLEAIHPDDRRPASAAFAAAMEARTPISQEYRLRGADGFYRWVIDSGRPRFADDGGYLGYVGSMTDITERRAAEAALQDSEVRARNAAERLASVLESTSDHVIVLDREWRLTYMNENARRALSRRNPRIGASLWEMFPEEANGAFARHYREALSEQKPVRFEEYLPAFEQWLEVHAYPTGDGLTIFYRDVTERRQAEQDRLVAQDRISYLARHDLLTGLANRQQFKERLDRVLPEGRTDVCAAVHYVDLDGFKAVNDTLGHGAGDTLLQHVAERLQNCVRGSDLVARFGGDEFAILQSGAKAHSMAEHLADRIIASLAQPFELDGQPVFIGASIGIAMAPEDGVIPNELLKAADIALYAAKGDGRGVYRFYEPGMNELALARQSTKAALRIALARDQFELQYQPLVDVKTGKLRLFEALPRWRHPEFGMIPPAEFIPMAEETRLIIPIGEWVLRQACATAAQWPDEIGIAVNLSPVQFRKSLLVDTVKRTLVETGLRPARLQLEITESVLLDNDTANLTILQDLRRLGVQIAMDDFGTGYSSLSYLRSFPFDKIKLDRSFIDDLEHGVEAKAILHAVASLGSSIGVSITAEGIETQEQLLAVQREGYDEAQGYLFSRPVPESDIPGLILRSLAGSLFEEPPVQIADMRTGQERRA